MHQWFIARVRYGSEFRIAADIRALNFETYCPLWLLPNEMARAVFTSYVFVSFDEDTNGWQLINDVRGVVKLLPLHVEIPTPIRNDFIDFCKGVEARGEFDLRPKPRLYLRYIEGDMVEIDRGAYRGLQGRFVRQDRDTVVLMSQFFNALREISLPAEHVRANA